MVEDNTKHHIPVFFLSHPKKKRHHGDLLGGPVLELCTLTAEVLGSIPCQGTKIPHTTEQLSQWASTTEAPTPQ